MAIDSTSELLFRIGADTGDAEDNIARFRTLLGKDLDDLGAEVSDWSKRVFGDMSTAEGAMLGVAAGFAAAVVAAGAACAEAGSKYAKYVEEIDNAAAATGLSTEQMSGLHYAAAETGVGFESLTRGLSLFASAIVKAHQGAEEQAHAFQRLGISQAQIAAGEKDMMPLLLAVSDRFHGLASGVERAAEAKALFGKQGTALLPVLSAGSAALRELQERAAALGMEVGTKDVAAMYEYRAASHALKAELEAVAIVLGRTVMPAMEGFAVAALALARTVKSSWYDLLIPVVGQAKFLLEFSKQVGLATGEVLRLAKSLQLNNAGEGLRDLDEKAVKTKDDFAGLAEVIEKIHGKTVGPSLDERGTQEIRQISDEWQKVIQKFAELSKAGKLTAADMKSQVAAMLQFPQAMAELLTKIAGDVAQKNKNTGEELEAAIREQQEKTMAAELLAWEAKIARRREEMAREKSDTAENLAALERLEKEGYAKIARAKTEELDKFDRDLRNREAEQHARTLKGDLDAWAAEMDAMESEAAKKEDYGVKQQAKLEALRRAGEAKIKAEHERTFQEEIVRLDEHQKRVLGAETTTRERLAAIYQEDLARFGEVEKRKALMTANSADERLKIETRFAAMQAAILQKYEAGLTKLTNSQGWSGIFGNKFAQTIARNEDLSKEWATSQDQSQLMVQVALEGTKEDVQDAFGQFADAEGAGIANAIVYSKTIGEAMRSAAVATLESLAARSIGQAIYSLALGFLDIAEKDYAGAEAAFQAAAIFGTMGAAAAFGGRALAGKGGRAGSGGGGGAERYSGAGTANAGAAVPGPGGRGGGHVTVNVYGHVVGTSGVAEFCGMINDAVLNGDATLTATNTKTGQQVVR